MNDQRKTDTRQMSHKITPDSNNTSDNDAELPPEIGGRKGPEPTRYGDWENNGIASDFLNSALNNKAYEKTFSPQTCQSRIWNR